MCNSRYPSMSLLRSSLLLVRIGQLAYGSLSGSIALAQDEAQLPSAEKVTGMTVTPDGQAMANTRVMLLWRNAADEDAVVTTTSDEKGLFEFDVPADASAKASRLMIGALAPGWALTNQVLDLSKSGERHVELELPPASTLKLRVQDRTGVAIRGAVLKFVATDAHYSKLQAYSSPILSQAGWEIPTSDAEGVIEIPWLPVAPSYQVLVEHDDYASEASANVVSGTDPFVMTMDEGRQVNLRVKCVHDPLLVNSVSVSLQIHSLRSLRVPQSVPIDAQGNGKLRLKQDDHGTIYGNHSSLFVTPPAHSIFGSHSVTKPLEFVLHRAGTVHGRVIDASTGQGVANANVIAVPVGTHTVAASVTTDDTGQYLMKCPETDCEISVSDANFKGDTKHTVAVSIESEAEVPLFEVTAVAPLRGRVIDSNGEPAKGVLVGNSWQGELVLTDDEGRFTSPIAATASRLQEIIAVDLRQREVGVAALKKSSTTSDFVIQMARPGRAVGVIHDKENKPVAGAFVQLRTNIRDGSAGISTNHSATVTRPDGSYEFVGLAPGASYVASVSSAGRARGTPVVAKAGEVEIEVLQFDPENQLFDGRDSLVSKLFQAEASPDLSCSRWFQSEPLSLGGLRGKVVILHFWGTWCGPCKRDLPLLKLLHEKYADDGVVVIGVHTGNHFDAESVQENIDQYGLPYPIAIDQEDQATVAAYGVASFPTTVLIGRDGRFRGKLGRHQLLLELMEQLQKQPVK